MADCTVVGFLSYDFVAEDTKKTIVGGNLYVLIPLVPMNGNKGGGLQPYTVKVKGNTELYTRCIATDFSKSFPGSLKYAVIGKNPQIVDVEFNK